MSSKETNPDDSLEEVDFGKISFSFFSSFKLGPVRLNGLDNEGVVVSEFRPWSVLPSFCMLSTTLRKPPIRPTPSTPYRSFNSSTTKRNALWTAAWLDIFLPTGRISPRIVASHDASVNDLSKIRTLMENPLRGILSETENDNFSESSESTIWVSESRTRIPFRGRS